LIASGLDGEAAIKAAMYLTGRGVPAIAVETKKGGAKNDWRLYSLEAFHSDIFKEQWKQRADHKARIEALCGELTPADGGPINASTAYWEKYIP
ncbi:MAG: hypothetical protein ACF8R7_06500, partial [Phycisphaerales bacterium JB039]